jgi:hypothetical protein
MFYDSMWKVDDSREEERIEEEESKALKTQYEAKKEIEFINIDTDGRDSFFFYFDSSIVHFFPLTLLWLCYPISKFFFFLHTSH